MDSATFLDLSCTIKEIQFTGGQKQDIDVTTLCSTEQENINGLPSPSEISVRQLLQESGAGRLA